MLKLKPDIEFRSLDQPQAQTYSTMRVSRLISFLVLLLPLQTFAVFYDVSTTAELREALASAAEAGGDNTIRLAAGFYSTQHDGFGSFEYISARTGRLKILGDTEGETTLDGGNQNQILVTLLEDSISLSLFLSDLTVQNGRAADDCGGGLSLDAQTTVVEIDRLSFIGNSAYHCGGAIFLEWPAENLSVNESNFNGNNAVSGGAINASGWSIRNSVFKSNTAISLGGVLYRSGFGSSELIGNVFEDNSAEVNGVMTGCQRQDYAYLNTFSKNRSASRFGVGEFCGDTVGNLLVENTAGQFAVGPAGELTGSVASRFASNILVGNSSTFDEAVYGGAAFVTYAVTNNNMFMATDVAIGKKATLTNNIFLSNGRDLFPIDGDDFYRIANNYINTARLSSAFNVIGSNNIHGGIDLGFKDMIGRDFSLTSSSDLIDAGTTDSSLAYITNYDFTGSTARVIGTSIDIGPYEYVAEEPPDSDGDGLKDDIDNCPEVANEGQADFDSDGEGDACDSDDDNDGTNDEDDTFPFDASESLDTDGDGIGNNEDYDDDADGILDSFDNAPLVVNAIVVDSDNDGVIDSVDAYPNDPTKQFSGSSDLDGDGFSNDEELDYCTNPFDKNSQPELGGLSPALIQVITEQ